MKVVSLKTDLGGTVGDDYPRVATIPFDSGRQHMASLHRRVSDGRHLTLIKGAAERVTELCSGMMRADGTTEQLDRAAVSKAVDILAARGLRVLANTVSIEATPAGFHSGSP